MSLLKHIFCVGDAGVIRPKHKRRRTRPLSLTKAQRKMRQRLRHGSIRPANNDERTTLVALSRKRPGTVKAWAGGSFTATN